MRYSLFNTKAKKEEEKIIKKMRKASPGELEALKKELIAHRKLMVKPIETSSIVQKKGINNGNRLK